MTTLEYILLGLTILSLALHAIAPKTKTTADDKAAEVVDAIKDNMPKAFEKPKA